MPKIQKIEDSTQVQEVVQESDRAPRIPRLKVETSLPSAENNWEGTFSLIAIGLEDQPLTYTYGIGAELSKFYLQIIEAGLKARFSVVIGGLKTPEEVHTAIGKEIVNLKEGVFSTRTPRVASANFVDSVVAMALLQVTQNKAEFQTMYPVVMNDVELLRTKLEEWSILSKEDRSKLMAEKLFSDARAAIGYFKRMEEVSN